MSHQLPASLEPLRLPGRVDRDAEGPAAVGRLDGPGLLGDEDGRVVTGEVELGRRPVGRDDQLAERREGLGPRALVEHDALEQREDALGVDLGQDEGPPGRAQGGSEGSLVGSVAGDVADDAGERAVGALDDVVEVTSEQAVSPGQVADEDGEPWVDDRGCGQQRTLEAGGLAGPDRAFL